ncbi:ATP-binding protein [Streptomyces sp. 7R007]
MKQSAAKTLGVAALGAAIAAAGAGAATAASGLPNATGALNNATKALPAENLSHAVPGAGETAAHSKDALESGLATVQPVASQVLADGPTGPVAGLLGGLPVGQTGLPTHGLPVNGLPLG